MERNFIKRKMRELFRLNRHLISHEYYDLWIVTKEKFEKKDNPRIEALFTDTLSYIARRGHPAAQNRSE